MPDECRICEASLKHVSRIPVCPSCLSKPSPLQAEYFCKSCSTPFVNAYPLDSDGNCAICRENKPSFDRVYCSSSYEDPLRKLIQLFKYGKVETLAQPLGELMCRALPIDLAIDTIVAMPMHWMRKWQRGFNQAEALARPVVKKLGVPLSSALYRKKATPAQAGLTSAERRKNLKTAFRVKNPSALAGKRVLLIDDVFTTGASVRAASTALKEAGAAQVVVLTLARVCRRSAISIADHSPGQRRAVAANSNSIDHHSSWSVSHGEPRSSA